MATHNGMQTVTRKSTTAALPTPESSANTSAEHSMVVSTLRKKWRPSGPITGVHMNIETQRLHKPGYW